MMNSSATNSNTPFSPYLLSRFHQHLNHLNDMAFTHTKILQEIIEKRSNEPILPSPNGSISSSPSSSASTIDSIQQRKRSYPSNDNQDIKNENHLNKRPRKQSKPQQLLKIENKNVSNGQSSPSTSEDEDEDEEEMGEITQPTEKQNPLPPMPPSSVLPYPPFFNYIQDLARTNPSNFLENLAHESRRLSTFPLPPLFTSTISQQQNSYFSQLMLNNSFLNHFPTPSTSTINRFIPPTNPALKDHPTFPFHFSTPKKRRTKVTDTRLSPRIASKIPLDDFSDDDNASSPHSSDDHPSKTLEYHGFQISLTPLHLRKAKLLFFYTRYPSSVVLKNYFPDVRFDKLITAQLVKWFSNFREFFYQQIEKYARQCLAEGIRNVDDLVITSNSELYRVLNVHYNRSNQINVPTSFCTATQAALREFFLAILQQKDLESSWKKSIYKVMQRLDDQIPDFFKNDHWMHSI